MEASFLSADGVTRAITATTISLVQILDVAASMEAVSTVVANTEVLAGAMRTLGVDTEGTGATGKAAVMEAAGVTEAADIDNAPTYRKNPALIEF